MAKSSCIPSSSFLILVLSLSLLNKLSFSVPSAFFHLLASWFVSVSRSLSWVVTRCNLVTTLPPFLAAACAFLSMVSSSSPSSSLAGLFQLSSTSTSSSSSSGSLFLDSFSFDGLVSFAGLVFLDGLVSFFSPLPASK